MKRTSLLCLVSAAAVLVVSCKNKNTTGLFVPKDAAAVFHINPGSLSSKLSWDDIKKTTWFKEAYQSSKDSTAQRMMQDPEASGVDTRSDFMVVLQKRGRGGYTAFEGSIKDAKAFEAMLKQGKSGTVKKVGDWNSLATDDRSVTLWNNSKFAVLSDAPIGNVTPMTSNDMVEGQHFGVDSLTLFGQQLMSLSNNESLFEDDRFADVMAEKADMHFWLNTTTLYGDMYGMIGMLKMGNLLQGNATGGTINFEDGRIAARMKQFYGKEMQQALANWKMKKVDPAVLNRIASKEVIGVMAMNMDPNGLNEFVKALGLDGMANMFLGKQNMTLAEVLGATKGQMVLAVTDLRMKDTTMVIPSSTDGEPFTYTSSQPDMSVLFAADVAQKATFNKLLGLVKQGSPQMPFSYQLNNDWFVAGNKPEAVASFATGGNTSHPFADKLKDSYGGFYLDVQRLLKTNFTKEAGAQALLSEAAATWKDVVVVCNEMKDGVATSEMVINMVDGKTNSLKQLNAFIENMNAVQKKNKARQMEDIVADSVAVVMPPPPPAEAGDADQR